MNYSVSPNHLKQQGAAEDTHADDVPRTVVLHNSYLSQSLRTLLSHGGTPGWLNWRGGFSSCFCLAASGLLAVLQTLVTNCQSSFAHGRKIAWAQPSILLSPQPFPTSLSSFQWGFLTGKEAQLFKAVFLGTSAVEKTPVLAKCLPPLWMQVKRHLGSRIHSEFC